MPPSASPEHRRYAIGHCSLGHLLVAWSDSGLCAVLLADQPSTLFHDLQERFPHATLSEATIPESTPLKAVQTVLDTPRPTYPLTLSLDPQGTAFQRRVWDALQAIPAGETITYSELAQRLGNPKAVRAVASACAANPLAVLIPCHRVHRKNGALAGYRWGLPRKRALLDREQG